MEQVTNQTGGDKQVQTFTTEQFKGLLADKQAEVRRRQEAERINSQLQQQIEYLKNGGSAIEMELNARKAIDPHAPEPEKPQAAGNPAENDDNRPLTMNDLVEILGSLGTDGQAATAAQTPTTSGKVAGSVPGMTFAWFRWQQKPLSKMSDEELNQLAQEVD